MLRHLQILFSGRHFITVTICLFALQVSLAPAPKAQPASVKRVLILHSFGREFAPFSATSSGFRMELARQSKIPIEFLEASLETARFSEGDSDTPFVGYLRSLFGKRPPDLLVPFGAPAVNFLRRHRDTLFPGVPLLVGSIEKRLLEEVNLDANATAVGVDLDLPGIIENVLRILPETRNIEVVIGTSPLEKFWLAEMRREFEALARRVNFRWLNEFSFEDVRRDVAKLPRNTAIFYPILLMDAAGVPHEQERALEILQREANAPIFGVFDSQLGRGILGGPLWPTRELSRQGAGLAVRILRGEPTSSMSPVIVGSGAHVYDWRELRRWKINESRLPAGSIIRFRQPTTWELYKVQILGAIALMALQAGLIFILLMERKQRRIAQRNVDDRLRFEQLVSGLSAKFVHLDSEQIDGQIVDSLREVAQFLGFDFSTLSVFTGPAVGRVAFMWQAPGTPAMPSDLTEKDFPWMARRLFAGRDVSFLDPSELPPDAGVDRATAERIRNRSIHCVPLFAGEIPVGILNVGTFDREQGIAPGLLRRLRLLGEIFANALARKRAEESLRESEEKIGLATDAANLGVWTWDLRNDAIWATEKCRALYGIDPEREICFETFLSALHREDVDRVRLAVDQALRKRRQFAEEYRVVLSDGSIRWIGAFGRGQYNSAGEPIHMLGVSADLTARKQMEERLTRERRFLRQVIDVDPNFIFAKDRKGRFTLANQAIADAYGTTVENLIGKSDVDFNQNIEEVEFFRRLDQEVIDTRQERFIPEERITDANGRVHWLQTVKRPLFTDDGVADQVLGSATDVTERKRAEERFRLAVEASLSAIVMINEPGRIVLVNTRAEKLFGYERHELIGQTVEVLVPERFRSAHSAHRAGFFQSLQARTMGAGREIFARRKDGSEFLVEIGLNPIESTEGIFVLTAIVDITERKRTESELQRNREELAHVTRVSALGELAASLAHELNQPLTAILSNAQAAQRFISAQPPDLHEIQDILKDIVEDNSRAGEVIRRMRALVKKEDMAFAAVDMADVIREVMQLVHSDAALRNVQLSFYNGCTSALARGDKVQLQQVFLNLLLNAFEAMKETPQPEREVAVRTHTNGAGQIEISVQDHGVGLTSEGLGKMFEPFYTTKRDGLGMGLSICRSIVESHGGRLWAENNSDRGATFYFTVPAIGGEATTVER